MNTTYSAQINVHADIESAWNIIRQPNFVKEFFPEIKKDLSEMGTYIRNTHPNPGQVLPDYMVPHQTMGWTTGAGTRIDLPRKDVQANIESIDLQFMGTGNRSTITIDVVYAPDVDKNFFFAHRCVRGLMKFKMAKLKQELETDHQQAGWQTVLAQ